MYTSAELIQALQRRLRRSIRPESGPGEFAPGWQSWLDATAMQAGRGNGAAPEGFVAIFAAREPVFRTGYERWNTWRAAFALLRYDWRRAGREVRRRRWVALAFSLLFHLFWVGAMMWLMALYFAIPSADDEAGRGEESVIQVEYIGTGTPDDDAGGAPEDLAPEVETAASPAPSAPVQAAATPPSVPEPAQAPPQPEPAVAQPPTEQPLQVTETTAPDIDFVVPPVQVQIESRPRVTTPQAVLAQPDPREIVVPQSPPTLRPLPQREVAVRESPTPELEVVQRAVPLPAAPVEIRPLPGAQVRAPDLTRDVPAAASRSIPAPAPAAPASTAGSGQAPSGAAQQPGARTGGTPAPGAGQGTRPAGVAAGSGASPAPGTGALPTPRRGDDWGESTRNQPGGSSGLFNADGSPRLAGSGRVGGGLPPGTITEDYEKIDRMGTWLKRPPIDYQPTSLDRFWVPSETLLQEWVRRSITEVLIPIPGTGKSIRCAVVLLAAGGACGLYDPNMMDVEAEARPPPDVPFKPELHDDQDSLHRPAPSDGPG
ncbi:hypothetical protein E2F46_10275 [Luteimonas aestuarii]|uniref:Transmembrane repetitive protein n=1 Tax=Luteimonas aestuarii TaxID=453837 RepID=A0A4R5TMZ6_9GAMM|nr:hypothetical protein [Luteimonas aestuarii]TDK23719.1 hypothetical protein E2F46_10275 [Luteimonas aestuarii]